VWPPDRAGRARPRDPSRGVARIGLRGAGADVALTHHSDNGSQYLSFDYTQTLDDHDVRQSTGSVGDALDNALAECWVDSLKTELIAERVWRSRSQVELAVVEYIGWFNNTRLHSALGFVPATEYELRSELSQLDTLSARTATTAIERRTADRLVSALYGSDPSLA
jgi:transposase InsO family protein